MSLFERVANRNKKESLVENGDRIVVVFLEDLICFSSRDAS